MHRIPKGDQINEAPVGSGESLADFRAVRSLDGIVAVGEIDGTIGFQVHDHFRPSNSADESMHVARLMVLRVRHELDAAIVEATHRRSPVYPSTLGFSTYLAIWVMRAGNARLYLIQRGARWAENHFRRDAI
ncbi:MAG TPA: hypothetical protein VGU66_13710 [Candidatus Elarobacter sp.]|nr:hypothetical protein [Candidatus Elarobacter sp.]